MAHNRPSFGVALLFATGSAAHVQALQTLAEGRGLRLEKGGLYQGEQLIPCASEAEVYAALGLPFVDQNCGRARARLS